MRMGFQAKNLAKGNITIDSSLRAYVYLGKYPIPSQIGAYPTVDFQCKGMPQLYFDVPYNITAQDIGTTGLDAFRSRTGMSLRKLQFLGGDSWRATMAINNHNGPPLALFLRVFGRLDMNPPARPYGHGLLVRTLEEKALVFLSGKRMLRLAGDTYDVELTLPWPVPPSDSAPANGQDTVVNLPFSMQGKSISANTRGMVSMPYYLYSYEDDGRTMNRYAVLHFESLFWASGNQLQMRRIAASADEMDVSGSLIIDNSRCQTVYSRLSVIDNAKFP
ncbi:hypothetical protein [Janthinobacterium lividum]|uniref:hypothetical protein n=1 Tax=Janthinobacterium lividum TaxID=29581 RepID=UPI0015951082|nr:hypothetical protein [Janthinobacterium lividum]QKY08787.1 hypothetical protein G8765_14185 [Janthinobacterium lividum]